MARVQGLLALSGNWEPQMAAPFDGRSLVEFKSDLILNSTWLAKDESTKTTSVDEKNKADKDKSWLGGAWDKTKELANNAWDKTKELAGNAGEAIKSGAKTVGDKASAFGSYVAGKAADAGGYIADKASSAAKTVSDAAGTATKAVVDTGKKVVTAAGDAYNSAKDKIGNFFATGSFDNNKNGPEKAKVMNMLDQVSEQTGVNANVLKTFAAIESSLNPNLSARPKSSAAGLFQFLTDTWRTMLSKYGGKYGIAPDTSPFDPKANALMGAEFLKENAANVFNTLALTPVCSDTWSSIFITFAFSGPFLLLSKLPVAKKLPILSLAELYASPAAVTTFLPVSTTAFVAVPAASETVLAAELALSAMYPPASAALPAT
jgi:hypothetical protein